MMKTGAMLAGLVTGAILLLAGPGRTGGKNARWKKFLPPDAYKNLVEREAKILKDCLKDKVEEETLNRAKLAAVMIAALSLSAENGVKIAVEHDAALQMAKLLQDKDKIPQARRIADLLTSGKLPTPRNGLVVVNMKKLFGGEVLAMMDHLRPKAKGGDGIAASLQTSAPLKGALNGIEDKIRALAKKKMTEANMKKSADEMVPFGYRLAVLAEVTDDFAPASKAGKKDPKVWHELSVQMRDSALEMAAASKKKDAAAIFDAAGRLEASCTQCHSIFR
jgi:hypothetical protein